MSELSRLGANIRRRARPRWCAASSGCTGRRCGDRPARLGEPRPRRARRRRRATTVHRIYHLDRGYESLYCNWSSAGRISAGSRDLRRFLIPSALFSFALTRRLPCAHRGRAGARARDRYSRPGGVAQRHCRSGKGVSRRARGSLGRTDRRQCMPLLGLPGSAAKVLGSARAAAASLPLRGLRP